MSENKVGKSDTLTESVKTEGLDNENKVLTNSLEKLEGEKILMSQTLSKLIGDPIKTSQSQSVIQPKPFQNQLGIHPKPFQIKGESDQAHLQNQWDTSQKAYESNRKSNRNFSAIQAATGHIALHRLYKSRLAIQF